MDREQALFSALSREENAKSVLLSLHLKQTQSIELISNALEHAARVYEEKKQLEENINLQEERMRAIESERITEKKKIEMQMRTQTAETHQFIRQLSQWENSKVCARNRTLPSPQFRVYSACGWRRSVNWSSKSTPK